jgi:hypothetical protein
MDKDTALASHIWQWDRCNDNPVVCANTVTSNSRLSFVSYQEWQGGTGEYTPEPTVNSVGNRFCYAWKGTGCLGSNIGNTFYYPWARSGYSGSTSDAWLLNGYSAYSVSPDSVTYSNGSLPVAWLASSIEKIGGAGTFASPYILSDTDLPTVSIDVTGGEILSGTTYAHTPDITVSGTDATSGLAGVKTVWLTGDGSGLSSIVGGNCVGGEGKTAEENCAAALDTVEFYTLNSAKTQYLHNNKKQEASKKAKKDT